MCEIVVSIITDEQRLIEGFTKKDTAAVALYTYDLGPGGFERNPYRLLNKALTGTTNEDLRKVRGLLYLVMCALRKLPRVRGRLCTVASGAP